MSQNWVALAGVAVALLAIPVSALATRRWGERKRKGLITLEHTSLTAVKVNHEGKDLVSFNVKDEKFDDPHLVSIGVRNIGDRDITSNHFDKGSPFTVSFTAKKVAVFNHPKIESSTIGSHQESPTMATIKIQVEPTLIKSGESLSFTAITQGKAEVEIRARLIDTELPITESVFSPWPKFHTTGESDLMMSINQIEENRQLEY